MLSGPDSRLYSFAAAYSHHVRVVLSMVERHLGFGEILQVCFEGAYFDRHDEKYVEEL